MVHKGFDLIKGGVHGWKSTRQVGLTMLFFEFRGITVVVSLKAWASQMKSERQTGQLARLANDLGAFSVPGSYSFSFKKQKAGEFQPLQRPIFSSEDVSALIPTRLFSPSLSPPSPP